MFESVNEPSFRLDVTGLPDPFEVLAFTGSEGISEPFAFDIDLLIDDPQLDLAGLLYRSAFLHFGPRHNGLSGQLQSVVQHEHAAGVRLCRVTLGPKLSCLALRFSQRIFSSQCVPQILAQVLKEHGIAGAQRRFDLHGEYPVRTFCTQYRESDLQFVQRLCAQARIHYYFEHRPDGHCLVFVDDPARFPLVGGASVDDDANSPSVRRWQMQVDASDVQERLARPGKAHGHSDLPTLRSARWLALSEHPFAECNRRWLLNRIEHRADPASEPPYSNRILASAQAPLAPPTSPATPPRMHSLQRAWVVTVTEPQPDEWRSVAVQFDWLYQGEGAAASHCWLPLSAALSETAPAALDEGVEVVVSFLEGDPDQPVISGVLQEPALIEDCQEPPVLPDVLPSAGLARWLMSAEPLLLLCLVPGGGSYNHCTAAICSCRLVASLGQGGAT
ncbi:contractile injection system protein, VgrG/Pvc8 family [Pseudomonas sp. W15Feb9B]|uniref:contractile injection system protein, VgrG/Pvc8 family n=1 Tax=Pseudomonas sp. W15Feb9B TaxID=550743 RepID=UPI000597382E|nr:contractile injection system protein, VgrG/Pvc8 family [Pseudomonas sp. W15Feb9B]KIK87496.1 type VI secretion protein [Pseudomonas sp. W15Feb9B]